MITSLSRQHRYAGFTRAPFRGLFSRTKGLFVPTTLNRQFCPVRQRQSLSHRVCACPEGQLRAPVCIPAGRVCVISLTQGPGTEARCNRLFQHLGWLACCSDLSAAGCPANTSPLTAVLQLAVYYCRGPQLRPPGASVCMPVLLLTVCGLWGAGAQSDTFQQQSLGFLMRCEPCRATDAGCVCL